jgi:hypothetical protein
MHAERSVRYLHAARGEVPSGESSPEPLLPAHREGVKMAPALVEITGPPRTEASDQIEFIADVDDLSSATVMLGCGDDNPYH